MKLEGLRVIDLTQFLPGPYLTLALADHGADVVKIEPPGGEPGRRIGPREGDGSVFFRNLNRGKRSLTLDLKDPAQRDALLDACAEADVLVESFRPGVMQRLGLDYAAVRQRNPGIIYCSISAFGQTGSWRRRPAHDLAVVGEAGLLSMTLDERGAPVIPGIPISDVLAGLQGLAGVLMALLRRQRSGEGDYLDISMQDAMVGGMLNILGPALAEGRQPVPSHERTTGGAAFYRPYRTGDGRFLVLAGQEPKFVHALLEALGRPDLIEPCLRGPGPHQQPVMAFLESTFAGRSLDDWDHFLAPLDLCYGRVNTLPEALAHPSLLERGSVRLDARGRRGIAPPIRFAHEPASPAADAPPLAAVGAGVGTPFFR